MFENEQRKLKWKEKTPSQKTNRAKIAASAKASFSERALAKKNYSAAKQQSLETKTKKRQRDKNKERQRARKTRDGGKSKVQKQATYRKSGKFICTAL